PRAITDPRVRRCPLPKSRGASAPPDAPPDARFTGAPARRARSTSFVTVPPFGLVQAVRRTGALSRILARGGPMSDGTSEIRGKNILVRFDGKKCIHARNCVLGRPDVFVPNAPGEWIHPDAARAEEIAAIAHACPSGAIGYERLDGGPQEEAPPVNLVRV